MPLQRKGVGNYHARRLEQVFQKLGQSAKGVDCQAMDGILAEAKEIMGDCGDPEVCDAAMLSAAQAVEHYEMTRYCRRKVEMSLGLQNREGTPTLA